MKHQTPNISQGFTLIELIVVIVILGTLAAIASPRFIELRSNAVIAGQESLIAGLKSAAKLTYMKSVIQNQHHLASGNVIINGESISVVYGYPAGNADGILKVMGIDASIWGSINDGGDWHSRASTYSGAWVFWHGSFNENAGVLRCYVRYQQAASANAEPVIDFDQTDC